MLQRLTLTDHCLGLVPADPLVTKYVIAIACMMALLDCVPALVRAVESLPPLRSDTLGAHLELLVVLLIFYRGQACLGLILTLQNTSLGLEEHHNIYQIGGGDHRQ